jgi:hypothetical protein
MERRVGLCLQGKGKPILTSSVTQQSPHSASFVSIDELLRDLLLLNRPLLQMDHSV